MKHWEIKRLDDIIESNIIGLTKNSSEQDVHHKFKYVKMNNITKDNCFDLSKYTCVNAKKEEVEKYSLSFGDFLFNTRNSYELVGKTCLFTGMGNDVVLYNNNIMRIRFLNIINPFFINYAFSTDDVIKKLDLIKSGTTNVSAIYYKDLKNLELLIPPLPEQQHIVAVLDKVFTAIAEAKANAEQNLKNAKELFESYLQNVFENKGEGWEEKTLGGIYDVRDGTHDSPKYQEEGFPLITSKNLKKDLLNYDNVKYISEQDYININKRSKVDKGDILFAMIGTIGNPVVIKDEPDFAIKNVALFKVPNSQNSNFLKYFLDAKSNIDKMMGDAKGTTQKFVGLGYLRAFKILLPPLKDQQIIVRKLDALSLETKKLEAIYQQKINDLEELKKSVLQKAFAGELKENLKEHYAENA